MKKTVELFMRRVRNLFGRQNIKKNIYALTLGILNAPIISSLYKLLYRAQIRRKSQSKPRTIVIEPYNICNLQCIMCPYPDMTREKEQMDMPLFRKIIDDAIANDFQALSMSLYNEPFLDSLLFEKIRYAKGKGMEVTVTTNGTVLDDDKIRNTLESGVDCITFSIDSLDKENYETIRLNAKFEETIDNVKRMLDYRKEHNITGTMITLSAVEQMENDSSLARMDEILEGLDIYVVAMRDNRKDGTPNQKYSELSNFPCWLPWSQLIVYSSGRIGLCCWDYDNAYELGDLKTQTIDEIWESDSFTQIRNHHLQGQGDQIELCKDCDIHTRQSPIFWWYL